MIVFERCKLDDQFLAERMASIRQVNISGIVFDHACQKKADESGRLVSK
ncbi:hypothetical protein [Stieleria mannarensis]|nr:hypothetical protein [Rhodopirellula sp. JC639]